MREQLAVAGAVVRDRRMFRIQLAFLGFNMTEYATWVAILVYAYQLGGASTAGVVAVVQLLPTMVLAPFAAYAGDRFRRDRVLFAGYLGQSITLGLVAAALFAGASLGLTLAVATVAATSFMFTRPTQAALLPNVSDGPEELTAANAFSTFSENAGIVIGPFVAGLVLSRTGPAQVFAIFAVVVLGSALLVSRLGISTKRAGPIARPSTRDVLAGSVGGFRFLFAHRRTGLILLVLSGGLVAIGALDVLFVAVAISLLDKGEGWAGFLSSASGLGGLIGSAFAVGLVGRRRLTPALAGGTLVFGGSIALIGGFPAASTAPVFFASAGAGGSVGWVAGNTLLQRIAPDDTLARVFGILEGMMALALAIGSAGASILIAAFGIRPALVIVGLLAPTVVIAVWRPLSSIDRDAPAPDAETLAFLRRIPIFAPLPPPAIERIATHLTEVTVPAGEVLIRQGDVGDRFLMIVEGDVEVSRDGVPIAERTAGDHIGEIALLRDVPRTATVTARTKTRFLVLDRDPFLEAVTGHPQSHARADAIVEEQLGRHRPDAHA
jgi:MFS family permease